MIQYYESHKTFNILKIVKTKQLTHICYFSIKRVLSKIKSQNQHYKKYLSNCLRFYFEYKIVCL